MLSQKVYRNLHTDLYLNNGSHHHQAQKRRVMTNLIDRAYCIADERHLEEELKYLQKVFVQNGYVRLDIHQVITSLGNLRRKAAVHIQMFCKSMLQFLFQFAFFVILSPSLFPFLCLFLFHRMLQSSSKLPGQLCTACHSQATCGPSTSLVQSLTFFKGRKAKYVPPNSQVSANVGE